MVGEEEPAGQKLPGQQMEQGCVPPPYVPAGQGAQEAAPTAALKNPAAQGRQAPGDVPPKLGLKEPAAQGRQEAGAEA